MNKNKELSLRGAAGDVAISCDKALSSRGRAESSDVVISCDKEPSFLSRCCASANQGISTPASCREVHKRRFLFNSKIPGIFRLTAKNRDDSFFVASPRTRFSEIATSALRLLAMTFSTLTLAVVLSMGIISEAQAVCKNNQTCGKNGRENECCWEIMEVINNGKTEKILTISPGTDGNGQKYTDVPMRNFTYSDDSSNLSDGYTSTYKPTAPWAREGITSIIIEDGISAIGNYAFLGETKITSVDMPSVTTIGVSAFLENKSLMSINMPNVTVIGTNALLRATSLTSVDMPKITLIGNNVFAEATSLEYVGLGVDENGNPLNVTIGENAFQDTLVSNCSSDNRTACGSCGNEYIKSGLGCVSDCGSGYLGKEGRCIDSANGCGENYRQVESWCNRIRYTPAEAAQYLKDTDNEIIMTFKVNR